MILSATDSTSSPGWGPPAVIEARLRRTMRISMTRWWETVIMRQSRLRLLPSGRYSNRISWSVITDPLDAWGSGVWSRGSRHGIRNYHTGSGNRTWTIRLSPDIIITTIMAWHHSNPLVTAVLTSAGHRPLSTENQLLWLRCGPAHPPHLGSVPAFTLGVFPYPPTSDSLSV